MHNIFIKSDTCVIIYRQALRGRGAAEKRIAALIDDSLINIILYVLMSGFTRREMKLPGRCCGDGSGR